VAATAILGTILVGVVLAKSRHVHQIERAHRKQDAVRAADELIAAWWASPDGVPVGQSGAAPTDGSLTWETRGIQNGAIQGLGARVVRVEIRRSQSKEPAGDVAADAIVIVDLVLPDASPEANRRAGSHPADRRNQPAGRTSNVTRRGVVTPEQVLEQGAGRGQ
jgi:hypothetical protein